MNTTASYLKTLRRIPDDIVLSMATREIIPEDSQSCICGWAIREAIARIANEDAEMVTKFGVAVACADLFGGSLDEWEAVFGDIVYEPARIERAFVTRVMEAAGVAS